MCIGFLCVKAKLFCVNASVSQASVCKSSFLRAMTLVCKRLSDSKSFLTCRRAEMSWEELREMRNFERLSGAQSWDEMKIVEKNLDQTWEKMRWDEKSWNEVRRAQIRWDEMKCGLWSVSAKCEVWSVQCEECSVKCGTSSATFGTVHHCRTKHARAWLAHGACKFYRWKRSYSITLRQLPPCLV
jgi:hypothetical protein